MSYVTFEYTSQSIGWLDKYSFKLYSVYENYSLEKVTFKLPFAPNKNKQIKFN